MKYGNITTTDNMNKFMREPKPQVTQSSKGIIFYEKQLWNREETIYSKPNIHTSMYHNYFY